MNKFKNHYTLIRSSNEQRIIEISTAKYSECPAMLPKKNNINLLPSLGNIDEDMKAIKVFPNPNNGNMTVEYTLPEYEQGVFEMYDLVGKRVYSQTILAGSGSFIITETNISKGIYFYQATTSNRRIGQGKIIIIK